MALTGLQIGLLAAFSISICLATCGIVARIYARALLRKRWEANDYLMVVSYVAVVGIVTAAFIGVVNAEVGVHITSIPASKRREILTLNYKLVLIDTIFFATATAFANISISHFYTTIFPHTWLVRPCHVQMCLLVLFWITTIIASCLVCRPIEFLWDWNLPGGGKCFDIRHLWLGCSITSLCFDASNLVMPMPILWRLRMDWRKKVRLTVVFGLGAVVLAVTASRIYFNLRIDLDDVTYTAAHNLLFTVPEPCLGILVGCLPIMSPVFTRASRKLRTSLVKEPSSGISLSAPQRPTHRRPGRVAFPGEAEYKVGFRKLGPYLDPQDSVGRGGGDVEWGNVGMDLGSWDWDVRSGEHEMIARGDMSRSETGRWEGDGIKVNPLL